MPVRFCARCGSGALAGAKFCTECGAPLAGAVDPSTTSPWRVSALGGAVLVIFLGAGLAVWTWILLPAGPPPGPRGPAAATAAAGTPAAGGEKRTKVDLPAEVKSFITELAGKAKAAPKDAEAWMKLAQVNARAAQLDPAYQPDAIAAFEHVLDLEPKNADALRGLANVHYDRDDHQKAIPVYERYLTLRPEDAGARTDLGTMYLYGGQPDRAIATYEAVIRENPSFLQAHYNLAVTYHGQGNDAAALKELELARALATEDAVRKQIDDMIASLKGQPPAGPTAAVAPPDGARPPFQRAVEDALRASPIMGARIVRFDWVGPASGRVLVQNFPMEGMPADVRDRFTARLAQEVREAGRAHPVEGPVRVEIADAASGKVMAAITP